MDPDPTNYVTVEIYDQTYHLSGQDAEHIRNLAAQVDAKMRAVAKQGRTVDSLRVAVLAALNLADELMLAQESPSGAAARVGHASGCEPARLARRSPAGRGAADRVLAAAVLDGRQETQALALRLSFCHFSSGNPRAGAATMPV